MPLIERVRTYWSNDAARERVRMIVPGAAQDGTSDTPADELQDGAPPEPATPRMEAAEVSPEAPPRTGGGSAGRFGWWR